MHLYFSAIRKGQISPSRARNASYISVSPVWRQFMARGAGGPPLQEIHRARGADQTIARGGRGREGCAGRRGSDGGYQAAISSNSCRNRHCPKCQVTSAPTLLAARQRDLLATSYFSTSGIGWSGWLKR